jgi:hypothetical protein
VNDYLDSADKLVVASSNSVFFTNPFVDDCGDIKINKMLDAGGSDYMGINLIIDPSSGEIKATQNTDAGFIEIISI